MASPTTSADTTASNDAPSAAVRAKPGLELPLILEVVGLVAAPVTVVAALLTYFGIVRARTHAEFFGIDAAALGYSTEDHIARSVLPMIGPLTAGTVLIALAVCANAWMAPRWAGLWRARPWLGHLGWLAAGGVAAMVLAVHWQRRTSADISIGAPLLLALGAAATAVGLGARSMSAALHADPTTEKTPTEAIPPPVKVVLAFVLLFASFGYVAHEASAHGTIEAREVATNLERLPEASLLSEDVLGINHRGVACRLVPESRYARRYVGLHLLAHRNGRYVLLPRGFDANNAVTIIVDESPTVRLEVDATPRMRALGGARPLDPVERLPGISC